VYGRGLPWALAAGH